MVFWQLTNNNKEKIHFAFFPWLGLALDLALGLALNLGLGLDLALNLAWGFPSSLLLVSQTQKIPSPSPDTQKSHLSRKSLGNNTTYHPAATGTPYPPSALP
jgi:hypothetical protein